MSTFKTIGSKDEVWQGKAERTAGKLYKRHLKLNKRGKVVSIKASNAASRNFGRKRKKTGMTAMAGMTDAEQREHCRKFLATPPKPEKKEEKKKEPEKKVEYKPRIKKVIKAHKTQEQADELKRQLMAIQEQIDKMNPDMSGFSQSKFNKLSNEATSLQRQRIQILNYLAAERKRKREKKEGVPEKKKDIIEGVKLSPRLDRILRRLKSHYSGDIKILRVNSTLDTINSELKKIRDRTYRNEIIQYVNGLRKLKKISKQQEQKLKEHKKDHGHSKKHMDIMKKEMKQGKSFNEAHNIAMSDEKPREQQKEKKNVKMTKAMERITQKIYLHYSGDRVLGKKGLEKINKNLKEEAKKIKDKKMLRQVGLYIASLKKAAKEEKANKPQKEVKKPEEVKKEVKKQQEYKKPAPRREQKKQEVKKQSETTEISNKVHMILYHVQMHFSGEKPLTKEQLKKYVSMFKVEVKKIKDMKKRKYALKRFKDALKEAKKNKKK